MKIKSKFKIGDMMIISLDGDILQKEAEFVLIDGVKYHFDIAYDIPSTIGVKVDEIKSDEVEFV